MNNTRNEAPSGAAAGRALKLSTLGLYAVSIMVACSSDPSTPTVHLGGAGAPAAGAANVAGAPAAGAATTAGAPSTGGGGDTGVAGAPVVTAGAPSGGGGGDTTAGSGGDGTAGAIIVPPAPPSTFYVDDIQWVAGPAGGAGGSGGAGAGGAAGAAGTAGTGGAATAMCSTATKAQLPYTVTSGFVASGYEGGDAAQSGGMQLSQAECTAGDRAPGAIGKCTAFTYTPASPATWAGIAYLTGAGFGKPGTPVCLADGATAVSFYAKGKVGGESVSFSATNASPVAFVLTTAWTQYSIPVTPGYSTDAAGLVQGFGWTIAPSP